MDNKFYCGIGSRQTPPDILKEIKKWAMILAELGYTLRSGGADGADAAFEHGCDAVHGSKEIYLPWKGFNRNKSPLFEITDAALALGKQVYGPRWGILKHSVKRLHARNTYQVLGATLDNPSSFVLCYTKDGCVSAATRSIETGGTGQAIACATMFPTLYNIPVFNLKNTDAQVKLIEYISERQRNL